MAVVSGGGTARTVSLPFFSVQRLLLWGAAATLIVLVLYPVGWMVASAFGLPGSVTLKHFAAVWARPDLLEALRNTLVIAASVAAFSVVVGVPLAWLVARTDIPLPGGIEMMVYLSFIFPSFLSAIA
ncbi:MAG: hypothetical protein WD270_12890 [Acetobacterales bacterium]